MTDIVVRQDWPFSEPVVEEHFSQLYTCFIRLIIKSCIIQPRLILPAILVTNLGKLVPKWALPKPLIWQEKHHLIMMSNITRHTRLCEPGTRDITPVGDRNRYTVKSMGSLSIIKCRSATYQSSFLPSAESLDRGKRNIIKRESLEVKILLKSKIKPNKLFALSYNRRANILMTHMRCLRNDGKNYPLSLTQPKL